MGIVIAILFSLMMLYIFLYSIGQLDLTFSYLKSKKNPGPIRDPQHKRDYFPFVTIQLPIYNEYYVIDRLMDAMSRLTYPKDKMEIQVLDDSSDDTVSLIRKHAADLEVQGFQVNHIQRPNRTGFKAGALDHGLTLAKGELIAIFDADFLPNPDFLQKTIGCFVDDEVGAVQTRWGHVNRDFSLLTKLQAFGLDAHFSIEQTGRNMAGSFINFNGTAGVWRKSCIEDAGGWSDDTLTEDLDLSYRAQLKGWNFRYLEEVEAPAELPVIMSAVKTQQYRWNKGAAESARKNLGKVYRSKLKWRSKIHATFHLLNSAVFLCLLIAAILSIPMLYLKSKDPAYNFLFQIGMVFLIGFFSIAFYYWISIKKVNASGSFKKYITIFPLFLTISMGLSLHNGIAVFEGLIGKKSPFIRTPKFNVLPGETSWQKNKYVIPNINAIVVFECIMSIYFLGGLILAVIWQDYTLTFFHLMLAVGFAMVFYYSIRPLHNE